MNIKINQNDYVQPTEVRENMVQAFCNIIMESYLDKNMSITIHVKHAEMYIGTYVKGGETKSPFILTRSTLNQNYSYIRLHSCEVDEAFKVIQDAGYFIYLERDKKTKDSTYRFSKKPVLDGVQAKNLCFDVFID